MTISFHRTLIACFALAITVMGIVSVAIYASFRQSTELDGWVVHTRDVIDTLNEIFTVDNRIESDSRGYVITGDAVFFERHNVDITRIRSLGGELLAEVQDNPLQTLRAQKLRELLLEKSSLSTELIAVRNSEGFDAAQRLVDFIRRFEASGVGALVAQMKAEEARLLVVRTSDAHQQRSVAVALGNAGLLVSLIIILLVFGQVRREGRRRMLAEQQLSAANQRLSGSLAQADRLLLEKEMIDRLDSLLHACASFDQAREIIGREVGRVLPDLRGAVFGFRAERDLVEVIASWRSPRALGARHTFASAQCRALESRLLHVSNGDGNAACGHVDPVAGEIAVCVPLNIHGEVIGVMCVEGQQCALQQQQLDFIRRLAEQIAMSLATLQLQQQLREQSLHDSLTGLFNRRYFESAIETEIKRADRAKMSLGFAMIDIDHFKQTNDEFGHQAGDRILQRVSETLRRNIRTGDILCRYGGEEFLVVLIDASLEVTREQAERLREEVERSGAQPANETPRSATTVSIGVAVYPAYALGWQDVLCAADQALYAAKAKGRNRVVVAQPMNPAPPQTAAS